MLSTVLQEAQSDLDPVIISKLERAFNGAYDYATQVPIVPVSLNAELQMGRVHLDDLISTSLLAAACAKLCETEDSAASATTILGQNDALEDAVISRFAALPSVRPVACAVAFLRPPADPLHTGDDEETRYASECTTRLMTTMRTLLCVIAGASAISSFSSYSCSSSSSSFPKNSSAGNPSAWLKKLVIAACCERFSINNDNKIFEELRQEHTSTAGKPDAVRVSAAHAWRQTRLELFGRFYRRYGATPRIEITIAGTAEGPQMHVQVLHVTGSVLASLCVILPAHRPAELLAAAARAQCRAATISLAAVCLD